MQSTMPPTLSFVIARVDDASRIAALVNRAYRGDSSRLGWTNEADLFDGPRTDENEVRDLISAPGSMILLCLEGDEVVGSVLLKTLGPTAYLGMLVTEPRLQGAGIGSRLMLAAEATARQKWATTTISITVVSGRDELTAFYQRRGYRPTGQVESLPAHRLSVPRVDSLALAVMEKKLDAPTVV
ncbi:MAG: GNAT family N-acetyltransferase [Burkholderiaceae bacterium]